MNRLPSIFEAEELNKFRIYWGYDDYVQRQRIAKLYDETRTKN